MQVENAKVTVYNNENEEVFKTYSADDGSFSLQINDKEDIYKVITQKEGYHFAYNLLTNTSKTLHLTLEISLRRRN